MDGVAAAPPARTAGEATTLAATRAADVLFAGTLFVVPFTKLKWESAGGLVLADVFSAALVAALALERLRRRELRLPRTALTLLAIGAGLIAVYSTGLLAASQVDGGALQVVKGLSRAGLHFALLAAAVTYLSWRPVAHRWRAVAWLCAGVAASALYGALQLAFEQAGSNLDAHVITPLTGAPARSLIYGLNLSPDVPRLTGLTSDPDHLGIMLIVPILLVLPLYLVLERGDRRRLPLALLLGMLVLVLAGTFSRSAILGLAAGAAVVAFQYRRRLLTPHMLVPAAAVAIVLLAIAARDLRASEEVVKARVRVDRTAMTHLHQYDFVPRAFRTNAAFGIGLENFGRRYASITGKKDFGPHSFYVESLTETGLAGTAAFALFLAYVVRRLRAARRSASGHLDGALVVGLIAVLVGTMVANVFYLTMTFYYFYAFLVLVVAPGLPRHRPE
jgi:O-antigen ligase